MSGNSPVSEKIIVFEIAESYNTVSLVHWGHSGYLKSQGKLTKNICRNTEKKCII